MSRFDTTNINESNKMYSIIGTDLTHGDELVQKFGVVYSAENYTEQGSMNYVINHTLSPGEVNQLIEGLNLKYIKVLDDPTVKPDADFVIITGDDAI